MNRAQNAQLDSVRDHGRSMIVSEHIQTAAEKASGGEIAGFPWQFVLVISVIVSSVLVIVLKVIGLF
jgi:hypothetical protein